jgi:hypothetical protein
MNDEHRPPFLTRILSGALLSALALAALAWFFISVTEFISKFRLGDPVVGFDKAWPSLIKYWRSDARDFRIKVDKENGCIIPARLSNQPPANVRFSATYSLPSR